MRLQILSPYVHINVIAYGRIMTPHALKFFKIKTIIKQS